jgi:transcriptional regulator with XRE-family HTH domain
MQIQKLPKEYMAEMGNRVRLLRVALRMDQRQFAKALETAQSHISRVEQGKAAPTTFQLVKLKELCKGDEYLRENLSWDWLMEGKGKGVVG